MNLKYLEHRQFKTQKQKSNKAGFFVHIQLKFAEKGLCFYFVVPFH